MLVRFLFQLLAFCLGAAAAGAPLLLRAQAIAVSEAARPLWGRDLYVSGFSGGGPGWDVRFGDGHHSSLALHLVGSLQARTQLKCCCVAATLWVSFQKLVVPLASVILDRQVSSS